MDWIKTEEQKPPENKFLLGSFKDGGKAVCGWTEKSGWITFDAMGGMTKEKPEYWVLITEPED